METDPVTGAPIPKEAIQRILHISQKVRVYRIPPLSSTKGFRAASWTQNPADQIFTARLRIIETAIPPPQGTSGEEKVFVHILLEDPSKGELFAAAPYTAISVVEQAQDSSRFFAIRVVGDGGKMKATLGMGFEERPDAFDFSVSLQDVRRTLGMEDGASAGAAQRTGGRGPPVPPKKAETEAKHDFSLKEGETITINIGGKGRKTTPAKTDAEVSSGGGLFSIAPPPGAAGNKPFLPPPPSAADVRAGKSPFNIAPPPSASDVRAGMANKQATQQITQESQPQPSAEELGFDDGEFGEFQ